MRNESKDFIIQAYLTDIKISKKQIKSLIENININYSIIGKCSGRTANLVLGEFKELYFCSDLHRKLIHPAKKIGLYIVSKQKTRLNQFFTNVDTDIFK